MSVLHLALPARSLLLKVPLEVGHGRHNSCPGLGLQVGSIPLPGYESFVIVPLRLGTTAEPRRRRPDQFAPWRHLSPGRFRGSVRCASAQERLFKRTSGPDIFWVRNSSKPETIETQAFLGLLQTSAGTILTKCAIKFYSSSNSTYKSIDQPKTLTTGHFLSDRIRLSSSPCNSCEAAYRSKNGHFPDIKYLSVGFDRKNVRTRWMGWGWRHLQPTRQNWHYATPTSETFFPVFFRKRMSPIPPLPDCA